MAEFQPDAAAGGVAGGGAGGASGGVPAAPPIRPAEVALLASVFVVAACGLVYELAAGALASYLLGDSVLQFSTVIGAYLFAMGIGSYLSRFFERQLIAHFLRIELLVGLVGGLMPAALFALHSVAARLVPLRAVCPGAAGGHAGRAGDPAGDAHPQAALPRTLCAQGAGLAGAHLRLPRRAGGRGGLSAGAGAAARADPHGPVLRPAQRRGGAVGAVAVPRRAARAWSGMPRPAASPWRCCWAAFVSADRITRWAEDRFYGDNIVYSESSPYQRVVVTSGSGGVRLFLNGNLQFHSRDEYRYHEALVHPAMAAHGAPQARAGAGRRRRHGGARGAAATRASSRVTLVELDPHMTTPVLHSSRCCAGSTPTRCARPSCASSTPTPSPGWSRTRAATT